MTITHAELHDQLRQLAAEPVPGPDARFAGHLEERLRGLAGGEIVAAPVPAGTAAIHRLPVRVVAGLVAVAAAVAGFVAISRPHQPDRLTHVGSDGRSTVTAPAPDRPSTPATTRPAPDRHPVPPTTAAPGVVVTTVASHDTATTTSMPDATSAPIPTTAVPAGPPVSSLPTASTVPSAVTTTTEVHHSGDTGAVPSTTTSTTSATSTTTSTTVATPTLSCVTGQPNGHPAVSCTWSRTTAARFAGYQLRRSTADGPWQVVFSSTEVGVTNAVDSAVLVGATYRYQLDVLDSTGTTIVSSPLAGANCCNA